jgi:hypothetical protein
MAYRGVVTTKDLVRVGRLLRAAGSHARHAEVNAQPALRAALDVIGLLDDVITECYERAPELRDWGTWGPSYFKWQEGRKCFHHVAFRLKRSGWKSVAGAGFAIPDHTGKIMWCINYRRSARHEWEEENHYLSEVVGKGKSFDVARLAQTFLADISKVGMIRRN